MTVVYTLVIMDQNTDPDVSVFRDEYVAIREAREYLKDVDEVSVEEHTGDWQLYATWGGGDDYLFVVKCVVN